MNTHAEAAIMLKDARELIERVGWLRGAEKGMNGAVCLHRALKDVDGTKHSQVVDNAARRIVLNLAGTATIPTYNDAPGRTKEDILDLLRAAENIAKELAQ